MPFEAGQRVGVYEIVGSLGAGGMGEVYRARDTRLGRLVAIKFVSEEFASDRTSADRLEREAKLTSLLNHPNIVTVHDVGELDGRPFIVMEFVAGQSLYAALLQGRFKPTRVIDIAGQVADGLAAAHAAGVVHRDLKPRNIMLTEDGRAKIVDFGIGKTNQPVPGADDPTVEAGSSDTLKAAGTPGYMSPEQAAGRSIDFRTDQFALGAIMYEMITGRRAFKRDSAAQTMAAIIEAEPEPIAALSPETPDGLLTVVERCLAKDPAHRYASTQDLARDLRDLRGTSPGSRTSRATLSRRTSRSRWAWVGVAGALVLAVAVALMLWNRTNLPLAQARALLDRYDKQANVDQAITLLSAISPGSRDPEAHTLLAEANWRKFEYDTTDAIFADRAGEEAGLALDEPTSRTHRPRRSGHDQLRTGPLRRRARRGAAGGLARRQDTAARGASLAACILGSAGAMKPKRISTRRSPSRPTTGRSTTASAPCTSISAGSTTPSASSSACRRSRRTTLGRTTISARLTSTRALRQGDRDVRAVVVARQRTPTAYSNLGTALYQQGEYADAARSFESAVALARSRVRALVQSRRRLLLGAGDAWAREGGLRTRCRARRGGPIGDAQVTHRC